MLPKLLKASLQMVMVLGLFAVDAVIAPAQAQIVVDITRGNVEPMPIALPPLSGGLEGGPGKVDTSKLGADIAAVISADLARSGLFMPMDHDSFIAMPSVSSARPKFGNWRAIAANALMTGLVMDEGDGRVRVEFRLWDVFSESQMTGMRYVAPAANWRRIAHLIADTIYKRMTGETGYFDTRVVYVGETGLKTERVKRLAIMDQDGANLRYLTSGADLVLTPRFSPTRQEITYLAFYNDKPRVYLYNIDTGKHEILGDFPGMTFAPRFSPDGNSVIMTLAENGNSDIYVMDLRTRRVKRLTDHPGIDTSPSYSPDSKFITFNSDRGGSQQLYVMEADGDNVKRISFGKGRYATPVWSPRGDLIAFTKIGERKFRIGVMRTDGSGERLLSDSYQDEAPTWSPNGRVLMFFRQEPYDSQGRGGDTSLWSVDLTGYNERLVKTETDASDPAWSPLMR